MARRLLSQATPVFVPLTVVLELESVLRAFYGFAARVSDALAMHKDGLDFADALHLLASSACTQLMTFDDRRFARRAKRLGLTPAVVVPAGSQILIKAASAVGRAVEIGLKRDNTGAHFTRFEGPVNELYKVHFTHDIGSKNTGNILSFNQW